MAYDAPYHVLKTTIEATYGRSSVTRYEVRTSGEGLICSCSQSFHAYRIADLLNVEYRNKNLIKTA